MNAFLQFAHLPLLLNPDRTKMSKRHGDVSVSDFRVSCIFILVLLKFEKHEQALWKNFYYYCLSCSFKNKGYLPESIVNFVSFLGWTPILDQNKELEHPEVYLLNELIEKVCQENYRSKNELKIKRE